LSIDNLGIHIWFLYIRFYAIIIMVGIATAIWLTEHRAKARGLNTDFLWNGIVWVIIPALIGARLYHVLTPQPSAMAPDGSGPLTLAWYLSHPLAIIATWNGGLGIYGGILGGLIGLYIYCRRNNVSMILWTDLVAPGLALGQAIARWGNWVNQELYGAPTKLPWAIYIDPDNRLNKYKEFDTFHPLFLYESLWNLAACFFLLWVDRRFRDRLRQGDLSLLYLMSYATIRFFLDFLRLDSNGFGPITTAQLVSLVVFIGSAMTLFLRHRMPASPTPAPSSSVKKAR
jgi:phosphatidylglycerol---prolipoprotein diacylglyceryl transferase